MNNNHLISARARGILFYIITTDAHISAEHLSKELLEGETAIASGLRELRDLGFLILENTRTHDGFFRKVTTVTAKGYEFFGDSLSRLNGFNPHFAEVIFNHPSQTGAGVEPFIARPDKSKFHVLSSSGFSGLSSREIAAVQQYENEEHQKKIIADYEAEREKWHSLDKCKRVQQFEARQLKPSRVVWTCTDVSFEFADTLERIWAVAPWKVTKSRFTRILKSMRLRYGTNGHIECAIIEEFFKGEDVSGLIDGDSIMSRFFLRFPSILERVKLSDLHLTEDERQTKMREQLALADAQWTDF